MLQSNDCIIYMEFLCQLTAIVGILFLKNLQNGDYTSRAKSKRKYTGINVCRYQWRTGSNQIQSRPSAYVSRKISTVYPGFGRLSGHIFFIISIAQCVTQIHSSHNLNNPVIDLESGYNNFIVQYQNLTMTLNFQENGVVLYESSLLKNHQLFSVSKILDYTDLSVANLNTRNSLREYTNPKHFRGYVLLGNDEYSVSYARMDMDQCKLYCASQGAWIINEPVDYFRITKQFHFFDIWVDTVTKITRKDDLVKYNVFLMDAEVFPTNVLNTKGIPKIFYQLKGTLHQVQNISTFYISYYDSQKKAYWPIAAYDLLVSITKKGSIQIYIPTTNNILKNENFAAQCACKRTSTQSRRIVHSMKHEYQKIVLQNMAINMSIEPQRFSKSELSGNVFNILDHTSHSKNREMETFRTYRHGDIAPLNIQQNENNSQPLVLSASTVATFAVRAVGIPMLQSAFKRYVEKYAIQLKAKMITFNKDSTFVLPSQIKVTGLGQKSTNFSIIITFKDKDDYERNMSGISNIDLTNRLLRNLSLTNQEFITFLREGASQYMMQFAARDIKYDIDYDMPILVVAHPSNSFVKFDYYFPIIKIIPSVTFYSVMTLPHMSIGGILKCLDLPKHISTNADNFHFTFPDKLQETKTLSQCLDGILAGKILPLCMTDNYSNQRIVLGMQLPSLYIYAIYTPLNDNSHIKISCPGKKQFNLRTPFQMTVLAISPICSLGLSTEQGTISVKGNSTYSFKIEEPKLLFGYNVVHYKSTDYYHTVMIITIATIVLLIIIIILSVGFYIFRYKVDKIEELYSSTYNSTETLQNVPMDTTQTRNVTICNTSL